MSLCCPMLTTKDPTSSDEDFLSINAPIVIEIVYNAAKVKNVFYRPMHGIKLSAKNAHNVDPRPNDTIDIELAKPLCFGNHIIIAFTGDKYPIPCPMPFMTPQPASISQMFAASTPIAVVVMPKKYKNAALKLAITKDDCHSALRQHCPSFPQ